MTCGVGAAVDGSIDATAMGPVTPTVEDSLCCSGAVVDGSLCSLISSGSLII